MIKLTQDEFGVLCLCALRYCHGRMTYMPSLIQSIVLQHKDELSDKDRACILQDKDFQRRCDLWAVTLTAQIGRGFTKGWVNNENKN